MTADNATPSVACLVQKELGLENATAFDINGACTGFIYALKVVEGLLKLNHKKALVIGSEVMSKVIDFTDRNTCILFGDGAGAVVVEKGEDAYFFTKSKGNFDVLYAEGTSLNTDLDVKEITGGFLYMDGREVFKFAIRAMEEAILKVLEEANLTIDDIDMIIPHQANQRIISNVAKRMKIDESKFFMNLEEYGNTSAASVAIALTEAKKQNVIKEKDKVILVGFGAGLTWGSTLIEI